MAEPVIKRRGNPNFAKKVNNEIEAQATPTQNVVDLNKQYVFQLLKTHDKAKPRDPNTNEITGSPYQPFWAAINSGTAWDPDFLPPSEEKKPKLDQKKGAVRRWRFLATYPTIWVDEQIDPEPSKEDLAAPENDLIFRQGMLRVFGHETMKMQALKLNNGFKDCDRPLKNVPKDFELLNQDKIDKEVLQTLDDAFEAEKAARTATVDEMYAVSFYFGIDLGRSDDAIRKDFINKARQNPKSFNREFINPKNKYKYTFLQSLADNIISGTQIPGKLVYVDTGSHITDLKTGDFAEELSGMCMANQSVAMNLYHKLEKILTEEVSD